MKFNFNIFWMIKSPYGKKQMMKFRLAFNAHFSAVSRLAENDFSTS